MSPGLCPDPLPDYTQEELTTLRDRVKELEGWNSELNKSLDRYQMDWASHTARIKELEQAMPDAGALRRVAILLNYNQCVRTSPEVFAMASRIEAVMRKGKG